MRLRIHVRALLWVRSVVVHRRWGPVLRVGAGVVVWVSGLMRRVTIRGSTEALRMLRHGVLGLLLLGEGLRRIGLLRGVVSLKATIVVAILRWKALIAVVVIALVVALLVTSLLALATLVVASGVIIVAAALLVLILVLIAVLSVILIPAATSLSMSLLSMLGVIVLAVTVVRGVVVVHSGLRGHLSSIPHDGLCVMVTS